MRLKFSSLSTLGLFAGIVLMGGMLGSCAMVDVPSARNAEVPNPVAARPRARAVNEAPDSVMYLPLGEDILVPGIAQDDPLPYEMVGPFELRNETLAGALQLILADYDIGLAFETNSAMEQRITVTNLNGELNKVVDRVCSLANLYCSYEGNTLIVKETQAFTVTLPPIGSAANTVESSSESSDSEDDNDYLENVATGLAAIIGTTPIVDEATRTIVYTASQRTAKLADRYFQRLRANTAMIVYETYIWEVQLTAGNSAGIDWSMLDSIGKFSFSAALDGAVGGDFTNPISIGLPTTGNVSPTDFLNFLSQFGAVKTISQPQITVLSGSSAEMRVADTQNYVSNLTSTISDSQTSISVETDTVASGFTLTIGSSWDKATVYTSVNIIISDVLQIEDFSVTGSGEDAETTRIQLPQLTERELNTQIRVRPGDSVLIGGLVRERDNFDKQGAGFMEPILPQSRTAETQNLELVIMMRPRVVVYTDPGDLRYMDYSQKKSGVSAVSSAPALPEPETTSYTSSRPDMPRRQPAPDVTAPAPSRASSPVSVLPPVEAAPVTTDPVGQVSSAPPPRLADPPSYRPASVSARSSAAVPSVEVNPLPAPEMRSSSPVAAAPASSSYIPPAPPAARSSEYVSPYETYDYYQPSY